MKAFTLVKNTTRNTLVFTGDTDSKACCYKEAIKLFADCIEYLVVNNLNYVKPVIGGGLFLKNETNTAWVKANPGRTSCMPYVKSSATFN